MDFWKHLNAAAKFSIFMYAADLFKMLSLLKQKQN